MNSIANSNAGNNNNINNNIIISKATELSVTSSPKFQTSIQTAYATRSKSADVKHEDKYGNTFASDTSPQNDDVEMINVNMDLDGEVLVKENQVLISSESDTSKIKLINFYTPIEGGTELIQTERSIALKLIPLANDLNNNYVSSSVTELSAAGKKFETELVHQDFHPTTTVNLSESNQNVYFMMQTTPIELITTTPNHQTKQATSNHMSTLNNKLFTSLTSKEPTTVAQTVNAVSSSSPTPTSSSSNKVVRDERRRANHNEVERRRRDNINKWIVELSKVIPDCSNDQSKHGQVCTFQNSKGGILEKTVQHLNDLNQALNGHAQSLHLLKQENQLLKEQNEAFKKENQFLKSKLGVRDSYPDSITQLSGLDTSNSNVSNSSSL